MPVLNTTHHPENRETTVLLRPKDLHRPSLAGLVVFVAIYFNCAWPVLGHELEPHDPFLEVCGTTLRQAQGERKSGTH